MTTRTGHPIAVLSAVGLFARLTLLVPATIHAQNPASSTIEEGKRLFDAKRYADARANLLPIAKANPDDAAASYWLGRSLYEEGNWGEASKWLEKAVKKQSGISDYHLWYAAALGAQAERANPLKQASLAGKIKGELQRAVALDATNLDARVGLISFYIGAPGVMGGSRDKAREQAREIKNRAPYLGGFQMARVALDGKDSTAAAREYAELVRAFPDSITPYTALFNMLLARNQADSAMATIDRLVEHHPNYMVAKYATGRIAAVTGKYMERGEAALKAYLSHTPTGNEPSLAAAHWRLGMIREKQGKKDEARAEYETAVKMDPKLKGAQESLKALK
ncbi:MAG: tetratricopeptide repeat protein [Gemmatimonadaceae bacterium]